MAARATPILFLITVTLGRGDMVTMDYPSNMTEVDDFLTFYGYLPPQTARPVTPVRRQAAVRQLQAYFHLPKTGLPDVTTMAVIRARRCAYPDVESEPRETRDIFKQLSSDLIGPQNYHVVDRGWPNTRLTWKISKYSNGRVSRLSRAQQRDAITRGLNIWANYAPLEFVFVDNPYGEANLDFRFETGYHLPEKEHKTYKFDGEGGKLAHAFPPTSGMVHFDDDEKFNLGNEDDPDLYITAAHEIGHALGLLHSSVKGSLMAPLYVYTETLKLHRDDIAGIQKLYGGRRDGGVTARPQTTRAPVTRGPITRGPVTRGHITRGPVTRGPQPTPDICRLQFDAAFYSDYRRTMYVFVNELHGQDEYTFVYIIDGRRTLYPDQKQTIKQMFGPVSPRRVDAALFIPSRVTEGSVYLFWGTKVFYYEYYRGWTRDPTRPTFQLVPGYPRWVDATSLPERPRAAVSVPLPNSHDRYDVIIFTDTLVCDWDIKRMEVGSHCLPLRTFNPDVPHHVSAAVHYEDGSIYMFKGRHYYRFDRMLRSVARDYPKRVAPAWIKGRCGNANL